MDSTQALLNERRQKDDIVPVLPWPPATKARHDAAKVWSDSTMISPEPVDITAEETCPAPGPQALATDVQRREPGFEPAQAPSPAAFELMNQLDALAQDLAVRSRASSDQRSENEIVQEIIQENVQENVQANVQANVQENVQAQEEEKKEEVRNPAALPAPEPSIRVSPPPSGFEDNQFAADRRSAGRRKVLRLASFATAALIGVGATIAWQSYGVSTAKPSGDAGVAAEQPASAAQVAASNSAPAPVAPELAKQLDTMAQDIALVRRNVEQLTAKQEQLAATQQQLEQLAAKQAQLAAKQEQLAQNIAKLQTHEPNVKQRVSASPPPRPAPVPPRVTYEPPPAPVPAAPAPRSEPHPLPPLPVPR